MMQPRPAITDWDYEWSYLSGELPQDERFIIGKTDNVYMTEEGLKFDGAAASLWLEDHNKIMLYIKLVIYYITGNSTRGYSVVLFGGQNDGTKLESEYLFTCKDETLSRRFMDIGAMVPSKNNTYGNYTYGVETDATVFMDFSDFTKGFVIYNGEKTYKKTLKEMWLILKSKIGTDNGMYGGEGYVLVKELKFKAYD